MGDFDDGFVAHVARAMATTAPASASGRAAPDPAPAPPPAPSWSTRCPACSAPATLHPARNGPWSVATPPPPPDAVPTVPKGGSVGMMGRLFQQHMEIVCSAHPHRTLVPEALFIGWLEAGRPDDWNWYNT